MTAGLRAARRHRTAGLAALVGWLAVSAAAGCGWEQRAPPEGSDNAGRYDAQVSPPAADLQDALEAARTVDLPEVKADVPGGGPATIFGALGAGTFVETLELEVLDSAGNIRFALKSEAVHQADPSALHVKATFRGLREEWQRQHGVALERLPANIQEAMFSAAFGAWRTLATGHSIEVIRYEDRHWTRSGDRWSAWDDKPAHDTFDVIDREWPVAVRLARAFAPYLNGRLVESPVVNGRQTTRYRIDNRRLRVRTMEGDDLHALWSRLTTLPNAALRRNGELPEIVSGGLDVWMHDDLVVRAEYEAQLEDGRTFRGRMEVREPGEPVSVRPPAR